MRNLQFWIPTIIGTLITPVFLFAAAMSTGAGHGNYTAALVLYPLSLAVMFLFAGVAPADVFIAQIVDTISLVLIVSLAVLQFPFYGFTLSYARLKGSSWATLGTLIIYLHLIAIVVWLVIAGIMWTTASS